MLLSNAFDPDPRVHREARVLVEEGYSVTIFGWDRDRKQACNEMVDGILVERIYVDSTHGRGSTQILYLFLFWIKAFWKGLFKKYDIVHAHDFDTLPLGYVLAKLKRSKLVYDSHESYVDMLHTLPAIVKKSVLHAENFLMKKTDLIITVGEILRQYLIDRGADNVCVVGNWQDPGNFIFEEEAIQSEKSNLGIAADKKVVVFIANLGRERCVSELIHAICDSFDTHLILGGNGPCADFAHEASKKYNNITYLGYVHPERVPFYTALADIVFYGFDPNNPNARFSAPNKLFECLAAGKSLITGDFGEIGKIVREMNCGVIVPDYSVDSIANEISNMTIQKLYSYNENSKQACEEKYSWDKAKDILLTNYMSL